MSIGNFLMSHLLGDKLSPKVEQKVNLFLENIRQIFNGLNDQEEPKLTVKLKKLDENAVIPTYAHDGDVGMDMTAISVEYDEEHDMYIYHTGLAFESNFNIGQFLFARSSNSKKECYLTNGVGIADSAIYRGEIQFRYKNRTSLKVMQELECQKTFLNTYLSEIYKWDGSKLTWNQSFLRAKDVALQTTQKVKNDLLERTRNLEFAPYSVGDRIGQMVFSKYPTVSIEEVEDLSESVRGTNGFGSTDKK